MGFDLNAFLGKASALRMWKALLPSAVVCELGGDLGLVPVTGSLFRELRAWLGEEEADRLDAAQSYPGFPSPSYNAAMRRWGSHASTGAVVAYVSIGEFGNDSYEEATLWSDGRETLREVDLRAALDQFRDHAGLDLGEMKPTDLEQYRGENAAEKWAAAALLRERGGA